MEYQVRTQFVVTEDHIKGGIKNSSDQCPVTLSICDKLNGRFLVDVSWGSITFTNLDTGWREELETPEVVKNFLAGYDENKEAHPFRFFLDLPNRITFDKLERKFTVLEMVERFVKLPTADEDVTKNGIEDGVWPLVLRRKSDLNHLTAWGHKPFRELGKGVMELRFDPQRFRHTFWSKVEFAYLILEPSAYGHNRLKLQSGIHTANYRFRQIRQIDIGNVVNWQWVFFNPEDPHRDFNIQ